jgi:hypothetical protein
VKQGALPGAARSHDRNVLAGGDRKVRTLQYRTLAPCEPYSQPSDFHGRRKRAIEMATCGGIKATNNARPPNAEYVIGAFCKACHGRAIMIAGREIP